MNEFADKVVVVTGAAGGLGLKYAEAFAERGAKVAIADVTAERGEAAAAALRARGRDVRFFACDVADWESMRRTGEVLSEAYGRADVLVNNAAVYGTLVRGPFDQLAVAEWDRVMSVNVKGVWLAVRALAPLLKISGVARIINISSSTVMYGTENVLHYVASKAAVIGMTRSLARELGKHGVRVNCVAPGLVHDTESNEKLPGFIKERQIQSRVLPRELHADDMVGTVIYLASSASDMMTGQVLNVDGGTAFY